jgi:secondary thiamine-phosphate synthase enzyme
VTDRASNVHHQEELRVATHGRGLTEITDVVRKIVERSGVRTGLVHVYCQHTSASLLIQENADRTAARDLLQWFERLAPAGDPRYTHTAEGDDDMAAHLRAAVTRTSETIPVSQGELCTGTWQGIFLFEHRESAHTRVLLVHVHGD